MLSLLRFVYLQCDALKMEVFETNPADLCMISRNDENVRFGLTYSGRKCDGWTAAFNRGSLLCLEAIQPKGNPHIPSSFHPSRTTPSPSHSPRHSPGYYPSHSYQQNPSLSSIGFTYISNPCSVCRVPHYILYSIEEHDFSTSRRKFSY